MNATEAGATTLRALLAEARARLSDPREAAILLAHALGLRSETWYAHPQEPVTPEMARKALALVARRCAGEPVAYLTGEREFYGLRLAVAAPVLIPRAETELLIELALARLEGTENPLILDAGTGSGAIALALAHERPDARVVASEASAAALAIAIGNAATFGVAKVNFLRADWLAPFADSVFDLIVSNPPYVASADPHLDEGDLPHEPRIALVSGDDGLGAIRELLATAGRCLRTGGFLVLEHGAMQQDAVIALAQARRWTDVTGCRDAAGLPRAISTRYGG